MQLTLIPKASGQKLKRHFIWFIIIRLHLSRLSGEAADRILRYKTGAWDTRLAFLSQAFAVTTTIAYYSGTVGGTQLKPKSFYQSWANAVQKSYYPDLPAFKWGVMSGLVVLALRKIIFFERWQRDEGLLTATAYNGRGITTGTLMGKCFADYIMTGNRDSIPLPFKTLEEAKVSFGGMR